MHPVSCTNTHPDVTDLINNGMLKKQKLEYLQNETQLFFETKKFLTCATDDTFWEVIVL